ncbi:MAG: WG repeat-containing protein [Christensenellales bacterium]|jgi:hypothetical protein
MALFLLLLSLSIPAFAEVYPVNAGDFALLVSDEGEITCPRGAYSALIDLGGGAFAAQDTKTGLWCVADENGTPLTDAAYSLIYPEGGAVFAILDGKIGSLDETFRENIPCKYTQLVANGKGGFLGITSDPYDDRADGVYHVAADGTQTATGIRIIYGLGFFSEGLMPILSSDTNAYGYLSPEGSWAIDAQYDYAGSFHHGTAEAALESGLGLIDTDGNWLLTPRYTSLSINTGDSNMVLAQEDAESVTLIDGKTGEKVKTFEGEEIWFIAGYSKDIAEILYPDKSILIDEKGNVLREDGTDTFYYLSDCGHLFMSVGDLMFLVDLQGNTLSDAYRQISCLAEIDGKSYFAVTNYDVEVEEEADTGWSGSFAVEGSMTMGIINEAGKSVLEMGEYRDILPVGGRFILLKTEKEAFLYDLISGESTKL